jgi:hypothetical protein
VEQVHHQRLAVVIEISYQHLPIPLAVQNLFDRATNLPAVPLMPTKFAIWWL